MARINTDGEAEKSRGLFAARMEQLFCKFPRKQACRCLFKNPAIPASRACPALCLEANSWQFLHLAQDAKSRAAREASERYDLTIPCKLACEGIWKRSASLAWPSAALRLCPFRVYWCDWWFPIILPHIILPSIILSISAFLRPFLRLAIDLKDFPTI